MQVSASNLAPSQGFTIDTPHKRGAAGQTHFTRMLGHVLNVPGLAGIKPSDAPSTVMVRANNMAALTAAMLLKFKPQYREDVMTRTAGLNWTNQVLGLAKNYPGALGIGDAIRFSLALHFLVGILDSEAGKPSVYADGYLAFARIFKDVQKQRAGEPPERAYAEEAQGLGSLGLHPILFGEDVPRGNETPAQARARAVARAQSWDRWCADNAGRTYDPALLNKCQNPPLVCDSKDPATSDGRACRGLNTGWTPPRPAGVTYPAPANIPGLDLSKFQVANCGFAGTDGNRQEKASGIRIMFQRVFGRAPNNAEIQYYGQLRWCVAASGQVQPDGGGQAMINSMLRVRDAIAARSITNTTPTPVEGGPITPYETSIRTLADDLANGIQKAANEAFDIIGKGAQFIIDVLCQGFKGIFGPAVGGVICDIINILIKSVASLVGSLVNIVVEAMKSVIEFVTLMIAGKIDQAFIALLKGVGRMLFSLSAPITVPMLMGKDKSLAEGFRELNEKANRVTDRNPLFPLMLILAVVNIVVAGVSGSILTPPFVAITGLIIALSPMLAVFIAPGLKQLEILRNEALDIIETGIEKFIRFAIIIFQGVMTISALMSTFREQLKNYFNKPGRAVPGQSPVDRIKNVLERVTNGIKVVTSAFAKFNFKDISAAAVPLLSVIPELLLAILPDAQAEMPSLTSWIDAAKAAGKSVEDQERNLRAGAQELLKTISPEAAGAVMREQLKQDMLRNPVARAQAAKTAATIIGEQFKMKATYTDFMATFRAELLKV